MRETLPLATPGLQTSWFDPGTQVGSWYNSTNHHKENILGGHNLRQIRWICVDKLHCFKGDWLSVFDPAKPAGCKSGLFGCLAPLMMSRTWLYGSKGDFPSWLRWNKNEFRFLRALLTWRCAHTGKRFPCNQAQKQGNQSAAQCSLARARQPNQLQLPACNKKATLGLVQLPSQLIPQPTMPQIQLPGPPKRHIWAWSP